MIDITGFQRARREKAAEAAKQTTAVAPETISLTDDEFAEIMRTKGNVMAELKKLDAEFSDRSGVEALREQLKAIFGEKGLLPHGVHNGDR